MIIKSDEMYYFTCSIEFFSIFFVMFFLLHDCPREMVLFSVFTIMFHTLFVFADCTSVCKILTFSKDGIEVSSLFVKKFYKERKKAVLSNRLFPF